MSKALRGYDTEVDFRRLKDKDYEELRKTRAEERIRRVVMARVLRRRQAKTQLSQMSTGKGSIADSRGENQRVRASTSAPSSSSSKRWICNLCSQTANTEEMGKCKTCGRKRGHDPARYKERLAGLLERHQNMAFSAAAPQVASCVATMGLAASLVRMGDGKVKDCDVSTLLFGICQSLKLDNEELLPYFHKLVTQNWIEKIDDLDLVEDRHWEAWQFPEKIVILLRQELLEQQESRRLQVADVAISIGNMVSGVTGWLFGSGDDGESAVARSEHKTNSSDGGKDAPVRRSSAKSSARRASSEKPPRTKRL